MAQIFYYELPADLEEDFDDFEDEEFILEVAQAWFDSHPEVRANIRRGDILRLPKMYRNDATFIWDGSAVMPLDSEADEYGNVPPTFFVLDPEDGPCAGQMFQLKHWLNCVGNQEAITHNDFVWIRLTPEEVQQVKSLRPSFSRNDEKFFVKVCIREHDFYFASEDSDVKNWNLNKPLCVSVTNSDSFCGLPEVPIVLIDGI